MDPLPSMTLAQLREFWRADLYRHTGETCWRRLLTHLLFSDGGERFNDGVKYTFYLRLCRYLKTQRPRWVCWLPYLIAMRMLTHYKYKFGCLIPHATLIGRGLYLGHVRDIIINDQAVIGENCNISQGVTIGQANRGPRRGTPIIGRNVYIGPGAKIVGAVRVGDDVAIGANCVVTDDVPDHAVVVGIPGRVISFAGSAGYVNRTDYPGSALPSRTQEAAAGGGEMIASVELQSQGDVIPEERDRAGSPHCAR